jgi:hypothetical protein
MLEHPFMMNRGKDRDHLDRFSAIGFPWANLLSAQSTQNLLKRKGDLPLGNIVDFDQRIQR